MKILKRMTLASAGVSVMYIALAALLPFTELSFRTWAVILGQMITFLLTPLLGISILIALLWKNEYAGDAIKGVVTLFTVLVCGLGSFFICIVILLLADDERPLTRHLLVVRKEYENSMYYRPIALFFRKQTVVTDEDKLDYLSEKYDRTFFMENGNGRIYEPNHTELTITVRLRDVVFTDDYVEQMTVSYLLEGYEMLDMDRPCSMIEAGADSYTFLCLKGEGYDDIEPLATDISTLCGYAMAMAAVDSGTSVYEEHFGNIFFTFGEGDDAWLENVSFPDAQNDLAGLEARVRTACQREFDKRARQNGSHKSDASDTTSHAESDNADNTASDGEGNDGTQTDPQIDAARAVYDASVRQLQDEVFLQIRIVRILLPGKIHRVSGIYQFRHLQVVGGLHGNRDVGYLAVYLFLRPRQGLVGKHHLPVLLIRPEVGGAVLPDEPAKPLPHVQQPELRPQVHQSVAARCPCQPHDAFHLRPDFHQCLEPLRLVVLEG